MGCALGWRRLIDTAQPAPAEIAEPDSADLITTDGFSLQAGSIVLHFAPQKGSE